MRDARAAPRFDYFLKNNISQVTLRLRCYDIPILMSGHLSVLNLVPKGVLKALRDYLSTYAYTAVPLPAG
eukprot:SAG31_NODE_4342_length_3337_cov_1.899012_1_plen_70_part_00